MHNQILFICWIQMKHFHFSNNNTWSFQNSLAHMLKTNLSPCVFYYSNTIRYESPLLPQNKIYKKDICNLSLLLTSLSFVLKNKTLSKKFTFCSEIFFVNLYLNNYVNASFRADVVIYRPEYYRGIIVGSEHPSCYLTTPKNFQSD